MTSNVKDKDEAERELVPSPGMGLENFDLHESVPAASETGCLSSI